jgi:Fic family protein
MENNKYKQVDELKEILENASPVSDEQRDKLWKKFRLEWNYNSNHMEGNTLTYGQTELLILFGKTSGDKELQEYDEMKAHDLAIKMVTEEAGDKERPLTENFIRLINKTILVRPFWKEAITADGQNTRREIKIGQYKSMANSVRLANGEIFHYASPQETPALMHDLVNWYNTNQSILHPVELAALFHYKFVRIHPFDDGNGRGARLLMNYILLKYDYPPVIIKSEDKPNYLLALNKADAGDEAAFVDYIVEQLAWSLSLSFLASKGEDIEETHDWKKNLTLLKRNLANDSDMDLYRKDKNVQRIAKEIISPLLDKIIIDLKDFNDLFKQRVSEISFKNIGVPMAYIFSKESIQGINENLEWIRLQITWSTFRKNKLKTFNTNPVTINFVFEDSQYKVEYINEKHTLKKLYNEVITIEEQNQIISVLAKNLIENIESNIKTK